MLYLCETVPVRRFVKDLADFFEIGQNRVRIGLISFNRKVTMMLPLNEIHTKAGLDEAVDSIPYNGKGTNTGRALQEVVDKAFKQPNGDRADVENQVISPTYPHLLSLRMGAKNQNAERDFGTSWVLD